MLATEHSRRPIQLPPHTHLSKWLDDRNHHHWKHCCRWSSKFESVVVVLESRRLVALGSCQLVNFLQIELLVRGRGPILEEKRPTTQILLHHQNCLEYLDQNTALVLYRIYKRGYVAGMSTFQIYCGSSVIHPSHILISHQRGGRLPCCLFLPRPI